MLALLLSPLGKIAMYAVGALAAVGIIWGAIAYHDSQLKKEALFQYNQTQLQQTVKDQADQLDRMNQINTTQQKVVTDVNSKNNTINKKVNDISNYVSGQPTAPNDAVSPIILETLKRLKELN